MIEELGDVQRVVLHGMKHWRAGRHLMLGFNGGHPLHFLNQLLKEQMPTPAGSDRSKSQVSIGFTRHGLKKLDVPDPVLTLFALQSPAFWAGAPLRAASYLRMTDQNAPERWDAAFGFMSLDAVLTVHASDAGILEQELDRLMKLVDANKLSCTELPHLESLPPIPEFATSQDVPDRRSLVHFGFRDGVSRVFIKGVTKEDRAKACLPTSKHEVGEFVLGHVQDCGANPWIAGPGRRVWPDKFRAFFHNGSFGVLQQIEQKVDAFEAFVDQVAKDKEMSADEVKGKLCGRRPSGQSMAIGAKADPEADFDYADDSKGEGCPFGSHARRMNPRLPPTDTARRAELALAQARREAATRQQSAHEECSQCDGCVGCEQCDPCDVGDDQEAIPLAHFSATRPLLRRGMPYGKALWDPDVQRDESDVPDTVKRGLVGHFFCTSIEDQYEHLLGEWADRVPLGSPDGGGARDPFVGAHVKGDGKFEIPRSRPETAVRVGGLEPFIRTRGAAYLFYPSLTTLTCFCPERAGIAGSSFWGLDDQDGDE